MGKPEHYRHRFCTSPLLLTAKVDGGVSSAIRRDRSATIVPMTGLLARPILAVKAAPEKPTRPVALSAAVAASWCAGAGLVVCVALAVGTWFASGTGSFGGSIRVGALGWLVANGGGLHLAEVAITAIPLGGCLLAGWLLYRAGRWVGDHSAVESLLDVARGALAMAAAYCAVGLAVYALTRSGGVHADLLRTLVATCVLGGGSGGVGILRGAGLSHRLLDPIPPGIRAALVGGGAGLLAMFAAGALLLPISLVAHRSSAVALTESLHPGLVGGAVLALVSVAAVPNAVIWAGAYLAGPGFAVGTGTSVTPGEVTLGPLPAFPLLAALPRSGGAWWQIALMVLPLLAGAMAGVIAVRRHPVSGDGSRALRGGSAGLVAGIGFGVTTWFATGAIGPGRMREIGPDVSTTMLLCAGTFLVTGALAAVGARWVPELWSRRRTDTSSAGDGSEAE